MIGKKAHFRAFVPMPFDLSILPLLAAAAAVSVALGVIAWRRRAPGARAFAILMFATAEWAATYALEMVASDLPSKLVWEQLSYVGSALVGPAWLMFTLSFTDRHPRLRRRTVLLLLAVQPVLDWVLVLTNDSHRLMWSSLGFDSVDRSMPLSFDYGPLYFALLLYNYVIMLFGVWLITRSLLQSGRLYSRQSVALLVGVAAPLAGTLPTTRGLLARSIPPRSPSPSPGSRSSGASSAMASSIWRQWPETRSFRSCGTR